MYILLPCVFVESSDDFFWSSVDDSVSREVSLDDFSSFLLREDDFLGCGLVCCESEQLVMKIKTKNHNATKQIIIDKYQQSKHKYNS